MAGHTHDVHTPRTDLHHEQHVQAFQKDRVNMEEVAGQETLACERKKIRQDVSRCRGAGGWTPSNHRSEPSWLCFDAVHLHPETVNRYAY